MSVGMPNDNASSHSDSDMHDSSSNSGVEVGNLIYLHDFAKFWDLACAI